MNGYPASQRKVVRCLLTLAIVLSLTARTIAIDIFSRGSEIALGRKVAKEIESQIPLWEDQTQLSRVRRIGMSILAVCDRKDVPYEFKILNIDEPNAIALPGGVVYVTRGLLETVTSDDELAFVIAHEVGHVVCKHARKAISQDTVISILASILLGGAPQVLRSAADVLYTLQRLGYSRNQEREADSYALNYMIAAGYNPMGAITMLSKFLDKKLKGLERYFSTHPGADERIERLAKRLGITITGTQLKVNLQSMMASFDSPFLSEPVTFVCGSSIFITCKDGKKELWTAKGEKTPNDIIWYSTLPRSNQMLVLTSAKGNAYAHIFKLEVQQDLSVNEKHLMSISPPQWLSEPVALSPDGKMLSAISLEENQLKLIVLDVEQMKSEALPLGERKPVGNMLWQSPHERLFIPVEGELVTFDFKKGLGVAPGGRKLFETLTNIRLQAVWNDGAILLVQGTDSSGKQKLVGLNLNTGAVDEISDGIYGFFVGDAGKRFAIIRQGNNARLEIWLGDMPKPQPKVEPASLLRKAIEDAMPIEAREGICASPQFSSDEEMLAYTFKPHSGESCEVWAVKITQRQAQRLATDANRPRFLKLNVEAQKVASTKITDAVQVGHKQREPQP
jgi:Zn-dependent protease with chaperone function